MAEIKILVKDILGKEISNSSVVFNLGRFGLIERITKEDGWATVSGVEVGVVPITVSKEKYTSQSFVLNVENEEQTLSKEIILLVPVKEENIKEEIKEVAVDVVKPFIFNAPKNYDESKFVYKNIEENVKAQKDTLEKALKDKAHDIVQQQASNLTYTLGQQLTASIRWYVEERSKLNPLSSLKDLGKWTAYTSMVAGLYLIRSNLVVFLNKVLEKLEKGI